MMAPKWFGRGKAPSSYLVFVDDDDAAAAARERRTTEAGLTLVGKHTTDGNTYLVLRGDDPERAKEFLRDEPVTTEFTYLVVETPDGVWGADINTVYLESLRPWQRNTAEADTEGSVTALVNGYHNLIAAAQGVMDNFLVEIECGRCGHKWVDGVQYRTLTLVRCPACSATNRIDSSDITVTDY